MSCILGVGRYQERFAVTPVGVSAVRCVNWGGSCYRDIYHAVACTLPWRQESRLSLQSSRLQSIWNDCPSHHNNLISCLDPPSPARCARRNVTPLRRSFPRPEGEKMEATTVNALSRTRGRAWINPCLECMILAPGTVTWSS